MDGGGAAAGVDGADGAGAAGVVVGALGGDVAVVSTGREDRAAIGAAVSCRLACRPLDFDDVVLAQSLVAGGDLPNEISTLQGVPGLFVEEFDGW